MRRRPAPRHTGSSEDRLTLAVRGLLRRTVRPPASPQQPPVDPVTRIEALEREVQEVRTRVNALFFAVISVTLGDLVVRAVLS